MTSKTQKYWIGVVSREHVKSAVEGQFAQVCHGKCSRLSRMKPDDFLVFYSPIDAHGSKDKCRRFTAIGQVTGDEPYQVTVSEDFKPFRLAVRYQDSVETMIEPLLPQLSFTKGLKNWGLVLRSGHFEISKEDFDLIAAAMKR